MMRPPLSAQRGSVFVIILLAVAMFAALSYAVSRGSRSGAAALTKEQSRAAAQEIISYGNTIQKAVSTLRLRGCSESQLNFTNGGKSTRTNGDIYDYTNTSSPADESCNIFSPSGGNVTPKLLSSGNVDPSLIDPLWMDSRSFIVTATRMDGIGANSGAEGTDIIIWLGRLRPEVCMAINDILGIKNFAQEPPQDEFDCATNGFDGTFSNCPNALGDIPELTGKSAYCSGYDDSGLMYNYFQVLLVR